MTIPSRRQFLKSTGSGVALGTLTSFSTRRALASPNEKIALAFIGIHGMGGGHVSKVAENEAGLLDKAEIVTLCDVDQGVLDRVAQTVKEATHKTPRLEGDFRSVIEDPSIDAVVIATPTHWHAPIALRALQAGKDVYLEKPASHVFREGQLLVAAAAKHQRVFQHGTQMRSNPVTASARKILDSGQLGEIKTTKAWTSRHGYHTSPRPDEPVPEGVNYDMWLGPAPKRPFNRNRFHVMWRLYRDYGDGDFGDDGIHDLDMARWALGVDTHPIRITAHANHVGPRRGEREFPDNMMLVYQYADGRLLFYEERVWTPYGLHGVDQGNAFYGTEGYMIFSRRGFYKVFYGREERLGPSMRVDKKDRNSGPAHLTNFVDAVRTRGKTVAPAEVAHLSTALIQLGDITQRVGNVLDFDPKTETFPDNPEANTLLSKEYREPWTLPASV